MSRILHGHRPTFLSPLVQHAPLQELLGVIAQMAEDRTPGMKCVISLDDAGLSLENIQDYGWHRPIQSSKGETIGSIHLCSQDGASMEEPKQLLEELYQLAAVAYDRHQLQIEVIERSRLAALAVRISGIQSRSISLIQMLQECTEALVQDLDMAFARIWLLNEAETMLLLAASAGLSTNLHGGYSRVPVATSLKIGRMVRERQPMLTNRILEENWIKEPEWAKREGLVAYAGYPLIAEDRVVGVIAMFSKNTVPENTLQALAAIAAGLAQAITKTRADEQRLERVRELEVLHQTASLLQANKAVPALLQQVVCLLPSAWRYAAIAEARIVFMGQEYSTPGFCLTRWHQMADFRLSDGRSGRLEIVYREERPAEAEGPFLAEERRLIDSLAEMLGNYLNRKQAERELLESRDALRRMNATLEEQVEERTRQLIGKQEELRSLAIALSRTEEQARQQLATDLHDNLAQMLALARMKLLADSALRTSRTVQDVNELLGESLGYTRAVMADLRPPLLSDAHDLHRAISWVVDRVQRRGLSVTIESDSEPIVLDGEVLTVTYQAIHELLFNVLKHAKTKEARLTLKCQHQFFEAVVTDYGGGFDVRHRSTTSKEGGFGLLNIQERVELLGGRLEISSQIGKGTCSKVTMPLRGVTSRSHGPEPSSYPHAAEKTAGILEGQIKTVNAMTRILLVDDHTLVRQGLRSILEEQPAFCVVAEAADGQMAIEAARELRPNIIVMDVNMPTMNGLEATRRITSEFPEIAVIGLSMNDDEKVIVAMHEAGATGYVSKAEAADKLVDIIEAARSAKIKG